MKGCAPHSALPENRVLGGPAEGVARVGLGGAASA